MAVDDPSGERGRHWTVLTGHGRVLVEIARDPCARMRELSARAGITERAVQLIVADLEEVGYITRHREGRRNRYVVNVGSEFRHPSQNGHRVGPFLELLAVAGEAVRKADREPRRKSRRHAPAHAGNVAATPEPRVCGQPARKLVHRAGPAGRA